MLVSVSAALDTAAASFTATFASWVSQAMSRTLAVPLTLASPRHSLQWPAPFGSGSWVPTTWVLCRSHRGEHGRSSFDSGLFGRFNVSMPLGLAIWRSPERRVLEPHKRQG